MCFRLLAFARWAWFTSDAIISTDSVSYTILLYCFCAVLNIFICNTLFSNKQPRVYAFFGGKMSMLEIGPVIFGGTRGIVQYLQTQIVLARHKTCTCGTQMVMQDRSDVSDGCRWRCPACHKCVSIRDGSFSKNLD